MTLEPAITDVEQLKDRAPLKALLTWNADAIQGAKFDRNELTIWIKPSMIREACVALRSDPTVRFDYLCDVTAVDWYPNEPRFEVVYHLRSLANKNAIRLKVKLDGIDPHLNSLTPEFPNANFYEREVFDLFGIRFDGHPYLRRIMMPDDWEGHPLRKDYPVEGYR